MNFDRGRMTYFPLVKRLSKVDIKTAALTPGKIIESNEGKKPNPALDDKIRTISAEIKQARGKGASVICAFGAHAIKNGLGPLLGSMLKKGWFTHLASNGAAVIHDWEFSWLGKSSEDVRENAGAGRFGTWEETGLYINLALAVGAWNGLGYGASVGAIITEQGLKIPEREELLDAVKAASQKPAANLKTVSEKAAAALDLYELTDSCSLPSGFLPLPHPYREYSLLAAARESGKPFTCHPMFGHDIIYTHKANRGSVIGRTAERDFLEFVNSVENLEGGVYLSIGSAVMSPMIFEKAISMARNALITENGTEPIRDCAIHVVDLQESGWDWSKGEPPMENPAYYLRYMKTFNRMGCRTGYITADNRDFLAGLYCSLEGIQ